MQIINRPIDSLRPYENNPRLNDDAVASVAESIRQFGFRQPIVVDAEGVIVIGHTRWRAAKHLGFTEVPVHVAAELTADQIRALRIADNKTGEIAEWDLDKLGIELKALESSDLDLDLAALGFDQDELAKLLDPGVSGGLTDPDEVPPVPDAGQTMTQPGDLWVLGEHRLLCGDSTEPEQVARLMDGGQADLLLTDPPYNVAYEGGTDAAMTIANDDMDDASYRQFLVGTLGCSVAVLRPGGAFYCWHADSEGLTVRGACADIGLTVRQCLIWVKSSLVLGRQDYQWKHEPCLYGWKDGAGHTWLSDRSQTTVLEFDKPARNGEHPTMKPVPLFLYLIQNSCAAGGVVIDPFGGSGTTLIAAEQTGRHARLMELDPRYCDVIVKRWEQFTGKQAQRIAATTNEQTPALAGVAGEA
jgi:DNA modification methylase